MTVLNIKSVWKWEIDIIFQMLIGKSVTHFNAGLAGFFHLVEETGLNPGLNRPGRNRFLPPEVEETGKNWKKGWNPWLSKYFPLQEAVILKTNETTAKCAEYKYSTIVLLFICSFKVKQETAIASWKK